ncbi:choline dehydrogenase [Alcanivorax sp. P2S70]|uniref:GMC oxidoreductase n=1 Tax=Alcanivorax sp. P2S70 TaxID=1397527 RepID=UPI0003B6DA45|nr:GMC oxidoreductase [Alcanivorax sp. P2S70]ERP92495.1 choline dehydrogenase [Alcanivorax sp. P2S70]
MEKVDVLVIGSGFGGAVMACRMAEKGSKVLVLERGRRWLASEYPSVTQRDWFWDEDEPEKQNGWIDFRYFGDMSVAMGAGVGGGSLIYANVSIEAKPQAFDHGWPEAIDYATLKPHYDTTGVMLNVQTLPENQWTPRTHLMKEAAEATGAGERFMVVPQAITFNPDWSSDLDDAYDARHSKQWTNDQGKQQGTCTHCGNCDLGCPVQAKNTLDLNYLAAAESAGAEIRPLHHVRTIRPLTGGSYEVRARDLDGQCWRVFRAEKVIVAAGSVGSTELLLRNRDQYKTLPKLSRALGHQWSCNGDFATAATYKGRSISPTRGPTISSAIDYLDGSDGGARYFVEDGGIPDVMGSMLDRLGKDPRFRGTRLGKAMLKYGQSSDPFSEMMPWFGQAMDDPGGRFYLGRRWYWPWKRNHLKLNWDYRKAEKAVNGLSERHLALTAATGGDPSTPPNWTLFKDLITPHPLGGCNMADSVDAGVVNHRGEVFNYPNLFVIDGAMVPRALGLNPSRTIAALAEYAASEMH